MISGILLKVILVFHKQIPITGELGCELPEFFDPQRSMPDPVVPGFDHATISGIETARSGPDRALKSEQLLS